MGDTPNASDTPRPLDSTLRVEPRSEDPTLPGLDATSGEDEVRDPGALFGAKGFAERYALERELGSGGMGSVRLHLDRTIGRRVAVKAMHPELSSSSVARARFVREACVQGQLEHPAVVPVYDLGVDPTGALYFSMKRIRGTTLQEILTTRRAGGGVDAKHSMRRLLTAFAQVCLAVDFAHRRGVTHRDLKPSNVMLGDFGEVYVLDWGLARLVGSETTAGGDRVRSPGDVPDQMTHSGVLLGTPGYMSPEQARGDTAHVGPLSDVYALGSILFEILTGKELHEGSGIPAILTSTMTGVEARASIRAPDAEVPPELEAICVRATHLEPTMRFSSARAIHDALERFLDGERDTANRRELAEKHARTAVAAVAMARDGGAHDARREAMREIGRALALDAGNTAGMRALVDLLKTPPEVMPPEVESERRDSIRSRIRWVGRVGAFAYASSFLYLPFVLWAGVREPWAIVTFYAAMLGCVGLSSWVALSRAPSHHAVMATMVLSNVGLMFTAAFYGPLILTPPCIVANTAAYAVHFEGRDRVTAIVSGALASLASVALWLSGALPGGYAFGPEGLTIAPGAVDLPQLPTITLLTMLGVGTTVLAAATLSRLRDDLSAAERQLLLYAWHLRELIPAEARGPTDPTARRRRRRAP